MRQDKNIAIKLRKEGKSYRQIQNEINISRSTLCDWFRNEEWSKHISSTNNNVNIEVSRKRILKMNLERERLLSLKYDSVIKEADQEFFEYINEPLFIAGLMLYAGEGDKLDKGSVRFSNVEFGLHKIFLKFTIKYLKVPLEKTKFSVILYPELNIDDCVNKWCSELGILKDNVYKPQVINGKLTKRKLHFGVGTSIILSSFLKKKILFWIEKSKESL